MGVGWREKWSGRPLTLYFKTRLRRVGTLFEANSASMSGSRQQAARSENRRRSFCSLIRIECNQTIARVVKKDEANRTISIPFTPSKASHVSSIHPSPNKAIRCCHSRRRTQRSSFGMLSIPSEQIGCRARKGPAVWWSYAIRLCI